MGLFDFLNRGKGNGQKIPEAVVESERVSQPKVTRKEVKYRPSPEQLREVIKPLTPEQLEQAERIIDGAIKGWMPVFVWKRCSGHNVDMTPEDKAELLTGVGYDDRGTGRNSAGNAPHFSSTLSKGYRTAKDAFTPEAYSKLMNGETAIDFFQNSPGFENLYKKVYEGHNGSMSVMSMPLDATHRPDATMLHAVGDVYLPHKSSTAEETIEAPFKCVMIRFSRSDKNLSGDHDGRNQPFQVMMVLGLTNFIDAQLHDPTIDEFENLKTNPALKVADGLRYRIYLRALQTDPAFLIKALHRVAPEVFKNTVDGRKVDFLPEELLSKCNITLDVQEMLAAGLPTQSLRATR